MSQTAQLSAVTSLLKYYPLPAALDVIASLGYEGVELWGGFPHAYVDDLYVNGKLDTSLTKAIKQMISERELQQVAFLPEQVFYPVNYLVRDVPPYDAAALRKRSLSYFERAIGVTAALEFPHMLVTTPFWGWRQQEDGRFEHGGNRQLDWVIDSLGKMSEVAREAGVILVLEPLTHIETTAVENLDNLLEVLDGVGSPNLAAMLDTGHINVTAHLLGKDADTYFREHVEKLGSRLQHMHIDDNVGDNDSHLLPGEGNFDFQAAYQSLKTARYKGFLSAEIMMLGPNALPPHPEELLKRTREHTLELWDRA